MGATLKVDPAPHPIQFGRLYWSHRPHDGLVPPPFSKRHVLNQEVIELLKGVTGDASQLVSWYIGYLFFSHVVSGIVVVTLAIVIMTKTLSIIKTCTNYDKIKEIARDAKYFRGDNEDERQTKAMKKIQDLIL
jgi:uncharacterized membrane protein